MEPADGAMNPNLLADDADEGWPGVSDEEAIRENPDLERPVRVVSGTYRISPQELNVVFLFFAVRTRRRYRAADGQECILGEVLSGSLFGGTNMLTGGIML